MLARSGRVTVFILLVILGRAGSAGGQEQSSAEASFPHLLLTDLRDVVGAPLAWKSRQWELFGLSVAGVGLVALVDGEVRDAEARDHSHLADQIARDFEPLGSTGAVGVIGVFYLAGLVTGDERARLVAEDGAAASIISGVILVPAIKYVAGRRRPSATTATDAFKPFSNGGSFPSGHAAEAFTVAAVVSGHYDSGWVTGISYGAATLVGFARIHHRAHFASDVVAAALLGHAVGRTVVRINQEKRGRLALTPVTGPHGEPGLAVVLGF
jgi:membrane-associated phospholipid phosphatase